MALDKDQYQALQDISNCFITGRDAFGAVQIKNVMQAVFGDYAARTSREAGEWKAYWTQLESWFEERCGPAPAVRFWSF